MCSIQFSPDDKMLVSGSDDKTIRVWDVNTRQAIKTLTGHNNGVWYARFSKNGKLIISCSHESKSDIKIWRVSSSELITTINTGQKNIWNCDLTSKDEYFLTSEYVYNAPNSVKKWDFRSLY